MLLLREIVPENPVGKDNHDEPVVLTEERTVPDNCEFVFESVNGLSPALEANGRFIQSNLDWDFNDQTDAVIMQNTNK